MYYREVPQEAVITCAICYHSIAFTALLPLRHHPSCYLAARSPGFHCLSLHFKIYVHSKIPYSQANSGCDNLSDCYV